eukprot:2230505-Karenia_brevis.AAC.1
MAKADSGMATMGMATKADGDSAGMATKDMSNVGLEVAPKGMATKANDIPAGMATKDSTMDSISEELQDSTVKGMATKEMRELST